MVRRYIANGKTEKHQLMAGTIETKSRWDGSTLEMEIMLGQRMTLTRRYRLDPVVHRLVVITGTERNPQARSTVYDEAVGQ
jgi:hypothetical protein